MATQGVDIDDEPPAAAAGDGLEENEQPGEEEPNDDDESYEEKKPRAARRGTRRSKRKRSASGGDDSDDDSDDDGGSDDGSGSDDESGDASEDGDDVEDEDGGKLPADRGSSGGGKKTRKARKKKQPGPVISNGVIDLPLGPVKDRLTCPLCKGYFREPYTIAECLHTFCKSCLYFGFRNGYRRCPTCDTSLEPDPYRECLADRTLESIVDKLFPHLKEADEREEREFYARRGIKLKKEFVEDRGGRSDGGGGGGRGAAAVGGKGDKAGGGGGSGKTPKPDRAGRVALNDDEMDFKLIPDETVERDYQMPPLEMSSLRASGHLKVAAIKKFLLTRLRLKASPASVEVCCNGDPLGDELSLTFIHRTRWMHPQSEVVLTFRFGEEGMY